MYKIPILIINSSKIHTILNLIKTLYPTKTFQINTLRLIYLKIRN